MNLVGFEQEQTEGTETEGQLFLLLALLTQFSPVKCILAKPDQNSLLDLLARQF